MPDRAAREARRRRLRRIYHILDAAVLRESMRRAREDFLRAGKERTNGNL